MLAGLLKAPSSLAPTNDLDRARLRAGVVLGRMQDEGLITVAQATAARLKPARLAAETDEIGGYFVDWVLDGLTDHLGKPERDLVVQTTLDRKLQVTAEAAVTQDAGQGLGQERGRPGGGGGAGHQRCGPGHGRRPRPPVQPVQPRRQRASPAGLGVQAVRLPRRVRGRLAGRQQDRRPAAADRQLAAGQFRRQVPRPDHARRGVRAFGQHLGHPPGADRGPGQGRGRGASAGRGLEPAAGAVDRAGHLGGDPARAHRRLPAVRQRRHPPPALWGGRGQRRCRQELLSARGHRGAGDQPGRGRGHERGHGLGGRGRAPAGPPISATARPPARPARPRTAATPGSSATAAATSPASGWATTTTGR